MSHAFADADWGSVHHFSEACRTASMSTPDSGSGRVHHQVPGYSGPVLREAVHPEAARAAVAVVVGNCPDSASGLTFTSQRMELERPLSSGLQYFIPVMVKFGRQARER